MNDMIISYNGRMLNKSLSSTGTVISVFRLAAIFLKYTHTRWRRCEIYSNESMRILPIMWIKHFLQQLTSQSTDCACIHIFDFWGKNYRMDLNRVAKNILTISSVFLRILDQWFQKMRRNGNADIANIIFILMLSGMSAYPL